jgi:hypothetical protein
VKALAGPAAERRGVRRLRATRNNPVRTRVALLIIAALSTAFTMRARNSASEASGLLLISVDSSSNTDTLRFEARSQPFPHPPVQAVVVDDAFQLVAATRGAPDSIYRLFIIRRLTDGYLLPMNVPAFARSTISEAIASNAFTPSPSGASDPREDAQFAFMYFAGVDVAPSDSTVVDYVSGSNAARYAVPATALVKQPALVVPASKLNVPRSGRHDYHFRLLDVGGSDSTIVVIVSKARDFVNARVLRWGDTATSKDMSAEQLNELLLYVLQLPHEWIVRN